ncbi:cyclic nucleotide-binding domain-containing protein [Rhizobium sp. AQ_MP]|uniref:cyclic nucleotide-binding domain-containing protein n=1 Tax=Rhizobium sp. AQ_MP TaxID=2761536 RepID=UPI001639DBF5|nr:cyclic nucleotide-binding domain-containing protein [Rhizobium sp. AQ_MP]MBC2774554.1 cyclic nucleotide-binding domain-containing protein [Rhizobium sp. AQ_MP]
MRKVLYILGQLNDEDAEWLARTGRIRTCREGELLIKEGLATQDLYFVLTGEVGVHVEGAGEVARLGRGEVVGEMSFVDSSPPSATILAHDGATVLAVEKSAIDARLRRDNGFAGRFYKAIAIFLADRLRSTMGRMRSTAGLRKDEIMDDELDESILDQVSLAGSRFEHMLSVLSKVN